MPLAASITRYLVGCGIALWLLMLVLQPEVGFRAPWPWMALFWALQIGLGLVVLQAVLRHLTGAFGSGRQPIWLLVLASGVLGSLVLAPFYWLIGEGLMQQVLAFPESLDDEPSAPGQAGLGALLLGEFLDIVGPVTAAWGLISLPRLDGLMPPLLRPGAPVPDGGERPLADRTEAPTAAAERPSPQPPLPVAGRMSPAAPVAPVPPTQPTRPAWRQRLPAELGQDLIAVASELQYLRVWTRRGCTLVLGALQEVEADEGPAGLRVHRSWWVDARHVLRLRRTASGMVCDLSDGRAVPVSRRRQAEVMARFGDAARYHPVAAAPDTPNPPSHG